MKNYRYALLLAAALLYAPALMASEDTAPLREPAGGWHHAGITGTFDRASLQRGFQVYKEVCATCHGLHLLSYRNLVDIGFTADEVKAIASGYQVADGPNDEGEMFQRPGLPSDRFVKPFPNDMAARAANNGALPPDLSLIVKARHGGENYIYSLLTGYEEKPPEGVTLMAGMYYNASFSGHQIAMPPPLTNDQVTYADGTKATVAQMSKDVATFLTWAAEPKLEIRKQTGIKVILFLIVFAGIMYVVKRRVWHKLH
ncbi:MAG: cytochrome c1 [Alphaproteobacteria bacterium]